jgi:ribonuclease D
VRKPQQLAVVRALWTERDRVAQRRDIAPGRILPDPCIVDVAANFPESREDLGGRKGFTGRAVQRELNRWWAVVREAIALDESDQPRTNRAADQESLPPPRSWPDRRPEAAGRLERARAAMAVLSAEHTIPVENLLVPDLVRRLCWEPPDPATPDSVAARLAEGLARPWQIGLAAAALATAMAVPDPASEDSAFARADVAGTDKPGSGRVQPNGAQPDGDRPAEREAHARVHDAD